MMKTTMQFISDRKYMLERANDIVAHNFQDSFMQGLFSPKAASFKYSSAAYLPKKNEYQTSS